MTRWHRLLIAAIAVALCGCATLTVDVDISKTQGGTASVKPPRELFEQVLSDPLINSGERPKAYNNYRKNLKARLDEIYISAETTGKTLTPVERGQVIAVARKNTKIISDAVDSAWANVNATAESVERLTLEALSAQRPEDQQRQYKEVLLKIRDYQQQLGEFNVEVVRALGENALFKDQPALLSELILAANRLTSVTFKIAASERTSGPIVGYPIFDEKIATLSRKSDNWEDFIDTKFKTFGGSAQFVAVREGLVVYRQKSLDFDPTPVVGAGTALAKLGLRVAAAQVTGTSLYDAKNADGSAAIAPSSVVDKASVRVSKEALTNRRRARMQAMYSLAAILRRLEDDGSVTPEERKAAVDEYSSVIRLYQGQLSANEVSNPGGS